MSENENQSNQADRREYGILGADLQVDGIQVPTIPLESWTPQDIIALHQVQLEAVKEKNRFFKWVIVSVIGGLLAGSANWVWRYYEHQTETELENLKFHTEVTKNYSEQLYQSFKIENDKASVLQTKRFAELLSHITQDETLRSRWESYHDKVRLEWELIQEVEEDQKVIIAEQLQEERAKVKELEGHQKLLEKQLSETKSTRKINSIHAELKELSSQLVQAKAELETEEARAEDESDEIPYLVRIVESTIRPGEASTDEEVAEKVMPLGDVPNYIREVKEMCVKKGKVCNFTKTRHDKAEEKTPVLLEREPT